MNVIPEIHALRHALNTCLAHQIALREALDDLGRRKLTAADLDRLGKDDRRLLDQFAYRYTRLQDDMGTRLMPAALAALGEPVTALPMLDRLNRLEQLNWLASVDEWTELRRIRNEFAHDYPESAAQRHERFVSATGSATRLLDIFSALHQKIHQRFPEIR